MTETLPEIIAECKVTYFFSKLLAKAGKLELRKEGITFIPSTLDRAMGAIDIPIPLEDIQGFHFDEALQKTLLIKTPARTHKFVGTGLNGLHTNLIMLKRSETGQASVTANAPTGPAGVPPQSGTCFNCKKSVKPTFKFCPYCKTQIKPLCPQCREETERDWISCAYCNTELKNS